MASGNASTSVLDLCSLSASASRETLRSLKGAAACPEVSTILNSFATFQIRECQRTICGAPNYKSRATSILNLDLNVRAGCLPVKSAHSSQAIPILELRPNSSAEPGEVRLSCNESDFAFSNIGGYYCRDGV